jgi:hypothetical protein
MSRALTIWYAFLIAHSIVVMVQLLTITSYEAKTYALVNVFRSVLPRLDNQRICMFKSFWSTPLVGRTVATIAELSFAKQLQRHTGIPIFRCIVLAQVFCWGGLLTGHVQFHVMEETIWTIVAIRIMTCCLRKQLHFFANIAFIYSCYMVFVDIPMYANRVSFPVSFYDGFQELATCKVSHEWSVWREDAVWMIGYFIGATQLSLFLN